MQLAVLIAPPGAGKGTQADLLALRRGFVHLETAGVIEQKFKTADPTDSVLTAEKAKFDAGRLVEPKLVAEWFIAVVRERAHEGKSIALSSSPRTVYEAEQELPVFEELFGPRNTRLFHIELSEVESVERNSARRICQLNRHPIPATPEYRDMTVCPHDNSPLIQRGSLDTPDVIRNRYRVYKAETEPVVGVFRSRGYQITEINGEQDIESVYKDIEKHLNANSSEN